MSYQTVIDTRFKMFLAFLLRVRISESDGEWWRKRDLGTGRIKSTAGSLRKMKGNIIGDCNY